MSQILFQHFGLNKKFFNLLGFILSLFTSLGLFADELDVINFVGNATFMHDDNFFRSSGAAGGGSRAENVQVTKVGVTFDKKISLQEFKLNYFRVMNRYQNNQSLDFDANNYNATWLWAITPELKGTIVRSESENLIGFTDRVDRVQNIRHVTNSNFDADWSPFGNWHLLGGFSKTESTTSRVFQIEPSTQNTSYNLGARYVFPTKSLVELTYTNTSGDFARKIPVAITLDDVGYNEEQTQLKSVWNASAHTTLTARIGYLSREFDTFSVRNFDGVIGGVNVNWNMSPKLGISSGISRGLSGFLSQSTSYGITDTFFITPTWQISPMISLTTNYQKSIRELGGAGVVVPLVRRNDDTSQLSVGLQWTPRSSMTFGLSVLRDVRDSNVTGLDYVSNSATINGQITF